MEEKTLSRYKQGTTKVMLMFSDVKVLTEM